MGKIAGEVGGINEKHAVGMNAVVATLFIVVANGQQDFGIAEAAAKFEGEKVDGLTYEGAIVLAIVVVHGFGKSVGKVMREEVAGDQDEGRMGEGLAHLVQGGLQEPPICVLTVGATFVVAQNLIGTLVYKSDVNIFYRCRYAKGDHKGRPYHFANIQSNNFRTFCPDSYRDFRLSDFPH